MPSSTREDRRAKALVVRPRGTQRILRLERSRPNPSVSRLAGGSRPTFSTGFGTGAPRGGSPAAVAAALARATLPPVVGPDVFQPQPVTPFIPGVTPGEGPAVPGSTLPPPPPLSDISFGAGIPSTPGDLTFGALGPPSTTTFTGGDLSGLPNIGDLISQPAPSPAISPEQLALERRLRLAGF